MLARLDLHSIAKGGRVRPSGNKVLSVKKQTCPLTEFSMEEKDTVQTKKSLSAKLDAQFHGEHLTPTAV